MSGLSDDVPPGILNTDHHPLVQHRQVKADRLFKHSRLSFWPNFLWEGGEANLCLLLSGFLLNKKVPALPDSEINKW